MRRTNTLLLLMFFALAVPIFVWATTDSPVSNLNEATSPAATDYVYGVVNGASSKIAIANVLKNTDLVTNSVSTPEGPATAQTLTVGTAAGTKKLTVDANGMLGCNGQGNCGINWGDVYAISMAGLNWDDQQALLGLGQGGHGTLKILTILADSPTAGVLNPVWPNLNGMIMYIKKVFGIASSSGTASLVRVGGNSNGDLNWDDTKVLASLNFKNLSTGPTGQNWYSIDALLDSEGGINWNQISPNDRVGLNWDSVSPTSSSATMAGYLIGNGITSW